MGIHTIKMITKTDSVFAKRLVIYCKFWYRQMSAFTVGMVNDISFERRKYRLSKNV